MTITNAPLIVSSRFEQADGHTIEGYQRTGGYASLRKALGMDPAAVTEEVKAANLLGRGGAGFPAGTKWGFLPPNVLPRYVVVNGDESEPGTYKDRILMERDPHQLIEGMLICCYAVGAAQGFLYVRGEMALAQERLAAALNEAYKAGFVGKDIMGSGYSVDIVLHWGAGAYIVGEETALIESLEGQRGMPRLKPPFFPASKGLYMQPTIVNNVETLSNLPWIIENGGEAFAALGNGKSTGTRLFAVSGHVNRPGVYEVEMGVTTFRDLVEHYCGGIREGRALKAFIPGGASVAVAVRGAPRPAALQANRGRRRFDARVGRDRDHGRDHRRRAGVLADRPLLRRVSRAASARRAARGRRGSSASCAASSRARAARPTSIC